MSKRILFVDDEPNVLQGLQRMLRPLRREWDMTFASSGGEALAALDRQPVDVLVTDMRMPGMDGAALLEEMVERHPHVIRIVLSGHAERETLMRAAAVAHQYLSKPCDPDRLRETVTQAFRLRELLADSRLKQVVSRLKRLPSVSNVYRDLINELESAAPSTDRIASMVECDVSMTAKMLHLVNSTFFRNTRGISSARQAVELLGLDTVKALALSTQVFAQGQREGRDAYKVHALGQHCMLVSRCARVVAEDQGADKHLIAEVTTAGMLHDVGKLALADGLGAEYSDTIRRLFSKGLPIWQIERDTFGASHAEVGAYLLGLWGIPEPVVAATAWHHHPEGSGVVTFTALTAVHAGNAIAHILEQRRNSERPAEPPDAHHLSRLGLAGAFPRWVTLCEDALADDPGGHA